MRFSQWFVGLAATSAVAGAVASGCGSSSKSGPADAGNSGEENTVDSCTPTDLMVNAPDSAAGAACESCVMTTCKAAVMECNADCTCGATLNMVTSCLAALPPVEAGAADAAAAGGGLGGALGGLAGGGGTGALTCFLPLASGGIGAFAGLAAGAMGGGGATDGGAPALTGNGTTDFLTCFAMTCSCLGALPTLDGGPPDGGTAEAGSTGDGSSTDAPASDGPSGEASSADSPSEAADQ